LLEARGKRGGGGEEGRGRPVIHLEIVSLQRKGGGRYRFTPGDDELGG